MYTLNKQVFNKLDTGWLAPNGDWYPCEYTEHLILADDLWKSMGQAWVPNVEQRLFKMAVSALKFKENYDRFWEEVKTAGKKGKETEVHHSGRVFKIREVAQ